MTASFVIRNHSETFTIQKALLQRLTLVPPFQGLVKRYALQRAEIIQNEHFPFLGCYLVEEKFSPHGDFNHAEPRLNHRATLGFSYVVVNNNMDEALDLLEVGHYAILKLFHFKDWHNFFPDGVRLESVVDGVRSHHFGNAGLNNTTPVAEMRMELTVFHTTYYQPIIDDVLDHVHIKAVYPWPEDPQRQPIILELDIETE